MFLGREALEDHIQLPKKANRCSVGAVASMYGGIGMSASSLHRESTDSLIYHMNCVLEQGGSSTYIRGSTKDSGLPLPGEIRHYVLKSTKSTYIGS